MTLRVASFAEPGARRLRRSVQAIGRYGNVLIHIESVPRSTQSDMYHWALGNGRKPPLDVSIDASDGTFRDLTFFVQDEVLPQVTTRWLLSVAQPGSIHFDHSPWSSRRRYMAESGDVTMRMEENNLVVAFDDLQSATTVIDMGCLWFLINQESSLSGLILPDLEAVTLRLMQVAGIIVASSAETNDSVDSKATRLIPSTVTVTVDFK